MRGVPPRAPRLKALDQRLHRGEGNCATVHGGAGSRCAESEAVHRLQADAAVRCGFAQTDAQPGRGGGGQLPSADRLARFRLADTNVSLAAGLSAQIRIEADNASNLGNGQIEDIRDDFHVPPFDVAEAPDDIRQRGDGPADMVDAGCRDVADTRFFQAGFDHRHHTYSGAKNPNVSHG